MKKIYIETYGDLNNLRYLKQGEEYLLMLCNDLYLQGFKMEPINFYDTSIIFDGNFHVIENLNLSLPHDNDVGLFNTLDNSIMLVKDLELSGIVKGNRNVGLLGGIYNGSIMNSSFYGITYGNYNLGGIVGLSQTKLTLNNCKLKMQCPRYFKYSDDHLNGYICGKANKLVISNCEYEAPLEELSSEYNEMIIKPKKVLKRKKD